MKQGWYKVINKILINYELFTFYKVKHLFISEMQSKDKIRARIMLKHYFNHRLHLFTRTLLY